MLVAISIPARNIPYHELILLAIYVEPQSLFLFAREGARSPGGVADLIAVLDFLTRIMGLVLEFLRRSWSWVGELRSDDAGHGTLDWFHNCVSVNG